VTTRSSGRDVGEGGERAVEVRDSSGVVIGDGNTQINYTYNALAVTGGVAAPPLVSVLGVVESPYRGLNPFEDGEEAFFFGRDAAATEILTRMTGKLTAPGLVMVSGESGAGKSSLLRAGVVPRARAASLAGEHRSGPWPCLVITPTRTPLDELAFRVAPHAGVPAAAIRRELAANPAGFALTARQAAAGKRLVLVVDQFEELFTQCPDDAEDERRAFITALHAAATTTTGSAGAPAALVVLGVRADFEARCARYPMLADAVQGRYMLMPMTQRQLRLVITEPACVAGSQVEDELVTELLREVQAQSTALPLLSYALDQAWRSRAGDTLRLADYERIGGLEGSVAASAGRAYANLSEAQQVVAQQVFMRLTATNAEGQVSAARATRAELETGADLRDVTAVLDAFADKSVRLLTLGADSVSISHEVLLTAWDRLREWLAGDLDDRVRYTRLRADARTWDANARPASYLYSAGRLAEIAATEGRWAALPGRYPPLDEVSAAFVGVSRMAARAVRRRRRRIMALLSALTAAAATTAGVAVHFAADSAHNATVAKQQHAVAFSRQLAAESLSLDSSAPLTARRLAIAAWTAAHTSQASTALTKFLVEQQQGGELPAYADWVGGVAFSPDGKLLAIAGSDGTQLWDVAASKRLGPALPAPTAGSGANRVSGAGAVAFSPGGKLLANADAAGGVQLWDPRTRSLVGRLQVAHPGADPALSAVTALAFSSHQNLLATADSDGSVELWNLGAPRSPVARPLARPSPLSYYAVAFSPDGQLVAAAGNGGIQLWNAGTGKKAGEPLLVPQAEVRTVAFSPDGRLLASGGGRDGEIRFWDPSTHRLVGKPLRAAGGPEPTVDAIAFSRNGHLLASAGSDGLLTLWDPGTRRPVGAPLRAGPGLATGIDGWRAAVAFSPDGQLLATGDGRGVTRMWDVVSHQAVGSGEPANLDDGSITVAMLATGGQLLTGRDSDGYVQLWNTPADGQMPRRLSAGAAKYGGVLSGQMLSPDGTLLAFADADGHVQLRSTVTGKPVGKLMRIPSSGSRNPGNTVVFSPEGNVLATATFYGNESNGDIRLWDIPSGVPLGGPIPAGSVEAIAVTPDGSLLATAADLGYTRLWSIATHKPIGKAIPGGSDVIFSPDGRLLVTADIHGNTWLWETASQALVARIPAGVESLGGRELAFSPDGTLLASAGSDGYVQLWNTATGQPAGFPIPTVNAGNSTFGGPQQVMFSPDGRLLVTVSLDSTVQPWETRLFRDPYAALCADVGSPTASDWAKYAPGEPPSAACGSLHHPAPWRFPGAFTDPLCGFGPISPKSHIGRIYGHADLESVLFRGIPLRGVA
jgi:WD40 repeat protein